ncbi:MAG: GGDEF domain-containing protein [Clostridiales bacterium]|nr:GGDEF domain-containing protein [Clostridiales bacterium]
MKQFKTNKIIFTVMLLGLYVISLYLLSQYSTLNRIDSVMISLIVIIGLIAIHLSIMISLVATFLITLGYGVFVILTGTMEGFEPVTVNYYYLIVPTTVAVVTGMIGLLNEKYLRVSDDFSDQYGELVRIDSLTGFRNEKDYYENLVAEVDRAKRYEQSLSLLLIHIESFDDLNHLYGLSQGEKFLKHLSEFIIEITRQSDQHYRIKHNLFAIILPNTDFDGTALLKERFIKEFESLNIVVKSSHQRVSIEIDIVFETYKTDLDAGAFHNLAVDNLIIGPGGAENEKNT